MPDPCLSEIHADLKSLQSSLTSLSNRMDQVVLFVTGDGNTERGAIVRLDRIEQAIQTRQKHIAYLWSAMIGMGIKLLYDLVRAIK